MISHTLIIISKCNYAGVDSFYKMNNKIACRKLSQ